MQHQHGQPHTFRGDRGDTPLTIYKHHPLRYRDVYEAVLIGFNRASGQEDDQDVYKLDLPHLDPGAVAQNVCVVLEERAGIFPNLPRNQT